ncbi:MAG: alpha/beta fold hydrolase, partial [Pseudomonadota bacterium]
DDAGAFEHAIMSEEDGRHLAQATIPYRGFLGFLLFDGQGNAIALDEPDWVPRYPSFAAMMAEADVRSGDGRLICLPTASERLIFALWAPFGETERWNLPASLRETVGDRLGCRIVLVAGGGIEPIEAAASSFGLSDLKRRVVASVVRTGSVRDAAKALGISYATARETMAATARHLSLPNTPAVVRAVVSAAFGVLPGDFDGAKLLTDMLRITPRQAQVALLISSGLARDEVASAIGISPSVVKKEMEQMFANFGVQSAAELARLIVEVQALRLFARSIDGAPGFLDAAIEPSRFTLRPNSMETIGWSDYGPASGKPVLVVHSNWSCRAVCRHLLGELQRRGFRPIAIDRPGFGSSQLGRSTREDPFSQAVDDALQVLDQCRIQTIPIIAKCGAQFVHVLKSRAPDRVGPVVLVSPTPQAAPGGRRVGIVGTVKEAYMRRPRLIDFFFRMICAQFTLQRVEQLTRTIVKGSPVDEALCDDPQFIRDRFRALRPLSTGNLIGGIFEEHIISHGGWEFAPLEMDDWVILQGDQDIHNSL